MKIYYEDFICGWVLRYPNKIEVYGFASEKEAELFYKDQPVGKEFGAICWRRISK